MLSVPPNTATEGSFEKQAIRSLFRKKPKKRDIPNTLNSSNHSLNCPNGAPPAQEGFARSSSSVLNNSATLAPNGRAHAYQQSRLSKSRSLLNVLRHRRRAVAADEKTLEPSNRPNLFSRILSRSRSPTRTGVEMGVQPGEELKTPPDNTSIDKKYELIRNKYSTTKSPSKVADGCGNHLSKTSQSTVKIACLLNGYTALKPPVVGPAGDQAVKHFDFEPFYSLASRRGRPEPPKKSADDKCDQCGQLAMIASSFDKSLASALEELTLADKDGHSFLLMADAAASELEEKCREYERVLNGPDLPEDARGSIQAAIGQARLLQNQKMNQFRKLCNDNVNGAPAGERETTNEDLAGFWDLLTIQVEKCKSAFEKLDRQRKNGWNAATSEYRHPWKAAVTAAKAPSKPRQPTVPRARPATGDGSNELREMIRQRRKNLKNEQQVDKKAESAADKLEVIEDF